MKKTIVFILTIQLVAVTAISAMAQTVSAQLAVNDIQLGSDTQQTNTIILNQAWLLTNTGTTPITNLAISPI